MPHNKYSSGKKVAVHVGREHLVTILGKALIQLF